MENKQIFFYVLVILIASVVGILVWRSVKTSNDRKSAYSTSPTGNTFELTSTRLSDLNTQLIQLLNEKTGRNVEKSYYVFLGTTEQAMVDKVQRTLKARNMQSQFTMDGTSMDEPILKMYSNYPKLFELLGDIGYLTMVGKIIATATWSSLTTNPSPANLDAFWQCIDDIDWKDSLTWIHMGSSVRNCLQ